MDRHAEYHDGLYSRAIAVKSAYVEIGSEKELKEYGHEMMLLCDNENPNQYRGSSDTAFHHGIRAR